MVLQFDKEVVPPEDVLQVAGVGAGLLEIAPQQSLGDEAAQATGRCYHALVVALEQFPIAPRLVEVPGQERFRRELHEVFVASVVLCEEREMVVELLAPLRVAASVV